MQRRHSLILILLIGALGCDEGPKTTEVSQKADADYIIFGHFHGQCVGDWCIEMFKLTDKHLFKDTLDRYFYSDSASLRKFVQLDDSLFRAVEFIRDLIPSKLLESPDVVYGMPDEADGGGIYLERSEKGRIRYWLIDKQRSQNPPFLNPFVDSVEAAIAKLLR